MNSNDFNEAIAAHDAAVAGKDCSIWVGCEPTYTDRYSEAAEWLYDALGSDKERRAKALVRQLHAKCDESLVLRSIGRQYSEEALPRWSYGLYSRRDRQPVWSGARDPLLCDELKHVNQKQLIALWQQLRHQLNEIGWSAECFQVAHDNFCFRVVARSDGQPCPLTPVNDKRLSRASIHSGPIPLAGLEDELANEDVLLFLIGHRIEQRDAESRDVACIELPAFTNSNTFQEFLTALAKAAEEASFDQLIITGFQPPLDDEIALTTVTPDPAVIEINMAPYASVAAYLKQMRELYAAADGLGLSPRRLHYNGAIADSGGGGHITLGGALPQRSVFIMNPHLLPRLIAYFNRHPSLSYYFAVDHVGSSGQSPRADEGLPDRLSELCLALETLSKQQVDDIDIVWQTLAPFMTDYMGNNHRSELNVEKLCNPYLPGRGRLGLIEFRAFRMAPTPERSASIVALLRAITAMLSAEEWPTQLIDWKCELHDRFALPFYLTQDLNEVLCDLQKGGVELGAPIAAQLLDDSRRVLGQVETGVYTITVKSAIEFWPLVGNVAAQEGGTSRLMDSSGRRLEITIRAARDQLEGLKNWQVIIDDCVIPMRLEEGSNEAALVFGLRFRSFYSQMGLHPGINAHGPIQLLFLHPGESDAIRITLYEWRPDNAPYDGLPADDQDAEQRRSQRFFIERIKPDQSNVKQVPTAALTEYALDLRRL